MLQFREPKLTCAGDPAEVGKEAEISAGLTRFLPYHMHSDEEIPQNP